MTGVIKTGAQTLALTTLSSAITSGMAWGTRYVSQIPIQDPVAAAMVGILGTLTSFVPFLTYVTFDTQINNYIKPSMTDAEKQITLLSIVIFSLGIGFLTSSVASPRLATLTGRNISYNAATIFSLVNSITLIPQFCLITALTERN